MSIGPMESIRDLAKHGTNYQTLECDSNSQNGTAESGQGGASKRAVYEPDNAQRCKQVVCSRNWAVAIVAFFSVLVLTIAMIAAFARPSQRPCVQISDGSTESSHTVPPTPPTATNGDPFPWTDIRLPENVIPIHYDLFMHPNLTTFNFLGTASIEIKVTERTDFIVIHSRGLDISQYEVVDLRNSLRLENLRIGIRKKLEYPEHEQVYFELEKDLVPSKRYMLILTFHGVLSDLMAGFYRSSYTTSQGEKRYLAVTQFEATDARAAFPCFDEPSFKASFQLTMVREPDHISLFNMPLVSTEEYAGGFKQDHFEASVKMSTYLVAFIVCDFTYIQNTTSRGTRVSVYAPKEQIQQAEFALDAAVTVLEYYELFFGIPYPLPKQDLIAIPDFGPGAMENWGLITYRMTALLYDPAVSTAHDKRQVAIIIAHELAHQWFGNLVTMQWWNDLWLNEGFASFVEYIGADRVNPEWQMMNQFVADTMVEALYKDSLSNSHPVSIPVTDPSEINEIFDAISYSKGASIIRMLEALITRDTLQMGLKNYLSKFQYSNAETDDLWQSLAERMPTQMVKGIDIKEFMDRYTIQMGYPVVMVAKRGTQVTAQQQQFLLYSQGEPVIQSPFENKWHIPLTYVTDQSPIKGSGIIWMKEQSLNFEIPAEVAWIKMNVNFTGYYRVHYDQNCWASLTQQLKDNHMVFSIADRSNLIDDSFALSRAGLMGATTALDLAQYLKRELQYIPWKVAIGNLEDIAFLLEGYPAYQNFIKYLILLMDDVLNELGWKDLDNYLERELRAMLLVAAVQYNRHDSVTQAKAMFDEWMSKGVLVKPEYKVAVYKAGIQYGGDKEWDFIWNEYQRTQVPSEKRHLLGALSATTNANKLPRLLEMSLEEDKVRKQDTVSLLVHISTTATGRVLTWNFFKQNWPEFKRRYGDGAFEISGLISGIAGGFRTQHDYNDIQSFFKENPIPAAKRAIAQSLERVQMNQSWLKLNQKLVTEWLENIVQVTKAW